MKLWGGRFSETSDEQMRALNDSINFDKTLYHVDIRGSLAYTDALVEAGLMEESEGMAIREGLTQILDEIQTESFDFQAGDEDIHTAVERRLIEIVGPVGGKLHTGRSRNDQVATDIRLWLRWAFDRLNELLEEAQSSFMEQAEYHAETLMPGYTHLQPAQPITAGHWLMSFVWMLQRDRQRLAECRTRINISPLGSSALAGSPYPVDHDSLAKKLDFKGVTQNSLDAVSDRDGIAEFMFVVSMILLHLSRFAEDVLIYSNPAFGFINLPDAFSTGSSIMPQKRNADPMELTRGKAGRIVGNLTGFLTTLKGLPSGYNKDLQEDKEPLFDTFSTLTTVLPVVAGMVRALTLVPEKMREALGDGLLATELADWLVLEKHVPFREAHHLVGQAVKLAEDRGVGLRDLTIKDYQSISDHFENSLFDVLDFQTAVQKRQSTGGTGTVRHQIAQARALLTPDVEKLVIRELTSNDQERVRTFMEEQWGSARMVSRGRILHIPALPGFLALMDDEIVGLVTYKIEDDACEVTSLNSLVEGLGIGSKFIGKVTQKAIDAGCTRLWLITTNDNSYAIRWYQKRGFKLVAVHVNALEKSRRLKPEIPLLGIDGIPLRDEIELEMPLINLE